MHSENETVPKLPTMDQLHNQGRPAFQKRKEPKKSAHKTQINLGANKMFLGVGKYVRAVNKFLGNAKKFWQNITKFVGST